MQPSCEQWPCNSWKLLGEPGHTGPSSASAWPSSHLLQHPYLGLQRCVWRACTSQRQAGQALARTWACRRHCQVSRMFAGSLHNNICLVLAIWWFEEHKMCTHVCPQCCISDCLGSSAKILNETDKKTSSSIRACCSCWNSKGRPWDILVQSYTLESLVWYLELGGKLPLNNLYNAKMSNQYCCAAGSQVLFLKNNRSFSKRASDRHQLIILTLRLLKWDSPLV